MSTQLVLDLSGAKLPVLSPQFLAAADNHRHLLELRGLRDNPIVCDCNARPFRRWLRAHIPQRHGAAAASFGGVGVAGGGGVSPTGTASQTLTASNRTPRQSSSSSGDLLVRVSASSGVGLRAAANSSAAAKLKDLVAIQLAANQQRVLGNSNNRLVSLVNPNLDSKKQETQNKTPSAGLVRRKRRAKESRRRRLRRPRRRWSR